MTKSEYDAETIRIEKLISAANLGKKDSVLSLAEKVAHNRERNRLQEVLREHKLNYFELVEPCSPSAQFKEKSDALR